MFRGRQFSGARVFRFNHIPHHTEDVHSTFQTWALNYAHAGQLSFWAEGGEEQCFDQPVVFWTWPGPLWRYRPGKSGYWDHYFISWKGPRAEAWQQNGLHPYCRPDQAFRYITDPKGFRRRFVRVLNMLSDGEPDDPETIHELEGLLLQIHLQPKATGEATGLVIKTRQLIQAVRSQPEKDWDFQEEALRLDCTPVHLRRIWRKETGMTPVLFLQKLRLKMAAALLRRQDLNIDEVSQHVGYETRGYFSRIFFREYKMSPRTYRKSFQSVQ